MISIKSSAAFSGAGALSAIAASLCCIAPVMALVAGSSSAAANFSWLEPARPYLIALSVAVLAFAWYVKLKPAKAADIDCNCEPKKSSFLQSKAFLVIVTVFALLMITFPLYAKVFYPAPKASNSIPVITDNNKQQVKFAIKGMTCAGCEEHINNELSKVNGVLNYSTSYATNSSVVSYDKLKVNVKTIEDAINKTGYKVTGYNLINTTDQSITFYEVPLVCNAAPKIGCGSRSKPALLDLEKDPAVKEAWLNRPGTIIAIVWKEKPQTENVAKPIFEKNSIQYVELSPNDALAYQNNFGIKNAWYRATDVDELSKEEASIIAESAVKFALKNKLITESEATSIKTDVEAYFKNELVKIRTNDQLNDDSQNKFQKDLLAIAEKYIGKERAEKAMDLYRKSCEKECKKEKSCTKGSGKSCCDKH